MTGSLKRVLCKLLRGEDHKILLERIFLRTMVTMVKRVAYSDDG